MSARVCVVVPAYDAMAHLPAALASVLAQSYTDYEVVVVDDGSNDGVAAWVQQQGWPHVRCVSQENRGLSGARNRGISESHAELVALLDADDVWEPDKLEKQVARLDASPEVGLVHCGIRYIDRDGSPLDRSLGVTGEGAVWDELVLANASAGVRCGSTPLIRRVCFDVVGLFDTCLGFSEDWDMWLRIAARFDFAVIDEPLVAYRQHPGNMTKNHTLIAVNQRRVLDKAFTARPEASRRLRRRAYGQALVFASWRAHLADDDALAVRHLAAAVRSSAEVVADPHALRLAMRLAGAGGRDVARVLSRGGGRSDGPEPPARARERSRWPRACPGRRS